MAETSTTRDIVAKLWNLCHILRDDGVTYNEYVTELTFLLFLKMMAETGREEILPNGYRWGELDQAHRPGATRLLQAPVARPRHQGQGGRRRHLRRRADQVAQADQLESPHRRDRQARLVFGARGRARQSL